MPCLLEIPDNIVVPNLLQDLGARGPILSVEAARCSPYNLQEGERLQRTHTALPTGSGASGDQARDATDCLVGVLDSCGTVKFTVFSFYTEDERTGEVYRNALPFARAVTTKIPAANAAGVSIAFVASVIKPHH